MWSLLPYVKGDNAGLVTIYNYRGKASLQFWRSVFERRAPASITRVEELLAGIPLGQGNEIRQNFSNELLDALSDAYREAAEQVIG
jgi:hypothetical protein